MSSSRQHMLIRILQRLFSVNGALADVPAHAHLHQDNKAAGFRVGGCSVHDFQKEPLILNHHTAG